jgi:hypothetical protein
MDNRREGKKFLNSKSNLNLRDPYNLHNSNIREEIMELSHHSQQVRLWEKANFSATPKKTKNSELLLLQQK